MLILACVLNTVRLIRTFLPSAFRRCTGETLLVVLLLTLVGPSLRGQSAHSLYDEGRYAAAAVAFERMAGRANLLRAGHAWYQADSLWLAKQRYLSVTTTTEGEVIVDSLSGVAFHKLGVIHYDWLQDSAAASYYRQAVRVRDQVFPGPHNERAHSRNNLANCLRELKLLDSAALVVRQSVAIYEQLPAPDSIRWLRTLNELNRLARLREDVQQARSVFALTEQLLSHISYIDPAEAFESYYLIAQTSLVFEDYEHTIGAAQKAAQQAKLAGRPALEATALLPLAGAHLATKQFDRAKAAYETAETILTAPGQTNRADLFFVYLNLATIASSRGQKEEGLRYAALAEVYAPDYPTIYQMTELALVTGTAQLEGGKPKEALTTLNQAITAFDAASTVGADGLARPRLDSVPASDYIELARLYARRAEVLETTGQRTAALADLESYVLIMDQLRGRVTSDASRRYLSEDARAFFDKTIDLHLEDYFENGDQTTLWRAFELSERAKAYTLLNALRRNQVNMSAREVALRSRIAELERAVVNNEGVRPQLESARLALDRVVSAQSRKTTPKHWTFDRQQLQQLLADRQMGLFVYHFGARRQYRFDLSAAGKIAVVQLGSGIDDGQVAAYLEAIRASAYRQKSLRPVPEQRALDDTLLRVGLRLRKLLLPPTEALPPRLCVIPDGVLNYLPFAALPQASVPLPIDYPDFPALQQRCTISYAYSASFLLDLQQLEGPPDYQHNVLAFAPAFQKTSPPAATQRGSRSLPGLGHLRYNEDEVMAIAELIPGTLTYTGAAADRQHFLNTAGSGRVVHISSHGVVNAADPLLSFIAFSQLGDSLELEEMLYFNDLSALRLPTEMAVLSACETSLGEYVPGETTLSLASAFAAAGARSTLTTLWQVDDAATKDLMVRFYQQLAAGKSRAEALALAQTSHRASPTYAHPYYWSAMTLYGASGPIAFAPGSSVFAPWRWVVGLLLVILVVVWRRRTP